MKIRINSYGTLNLCVPDTEVLEQVLLKLDLILSKETKTVAQLDDLISQVQTNTDAEASAVVLLNKLHELLVAAGTDPVKLGEIKNSLATSANALAAAVVANTPSEG